MPYRSSTPRSPQPPFSLALVTGATSGIGYALCCLLAQKKIPLLISGRNQDELQKVERELSTKIPVTSICADLAVPEQRLKLLEKMRTTMPDLVINNAGFGLYGSALSHDSSKHIELLEVNGLSVIEMTLEAARTLIGAGKKGVILNVSSAAGMLLFPRFASYSASKALVISFSRSFDYETAPFGVRVLTACPGVVATHFRQRAAQDSNINNNKSHAMSPEYAARMIWRQIIKRQALYLFDWKTRLGVWASGLLPTRIRMGILSNAIKKIAPPCSLKL